MGDSFFFSVIQPLLLTEPLDSVGRFRLRDGPLDEAALDLLSTPKSRLEFTHLFRSYLRENWCWVSPLYLNYERRDIEPGEIFWVRSHDDYHLARFSDSEGTAILLVSHIRNRNLDEIRKIFCIALQDKIAMEVNLCWSAEQGLEEVRTRLFFRYEPLLVYCCERPREKMTKFLIWESTAPLALDHAIPRGEGCKPPGPAA